MKELLLIVVKSIHKSYSFFSNIIVTKMTYMRFWLNDVKCGSGLNVINKSVNIWRQHNSEGLASFENNITFWSYGDHSWNSRCKIIIEKKGNLRIGNNTGFNGVLIFCSHSITIGNYVKVGGGTRIFDTDHHPINWRDRRKSNNGLFSNTAPIVIEDDVFIGAGCYIMKGVTIGARSVIAAGSVVNKDIPADEIWGGNPVRFIKKL